MSVLALNSPSHRLDHFYGQSDEDDDNLSILAKKSSIVKKGEGASGEDKKKSVKLFEDNEQVRLNVHFMAAFPSVPGGVILGQGEKMIAPKIAANVGEMTFDPERGKGAITVKLNDELWSGNINMMRSTQSHHYGRGFMVNEEGTQAIPITVHQNKNSGAGVISTLNPTCRSHLGNFAFPYLMGVF